MNVGEQISLFDQDGWFSKMSAECFPQTMERTSEPSLKKRQELQTPQSLFLDLRTDWVGAMLGSFWQTDGLWLGRYTLRSIGGVPQRRARVSLVADFRGQSAPEVLFESEGLSGNPEPSGETGEGTPSHPERSIGAFSFQERAG